MIMKGFLPPSDNDFAMFQLTGVFVGWWGDLPASRTNAEFYRLQATKHGGLTSSKAALTGADCKQGQERTQKML